MAYLGMDVDLVESLGNGLAMQADQLQAVLAAIDGLAFQATTVWDGSDAEEFAGRWMSNHRVDLQKAAQTVRVFAQCALINAAEQRAVSSQ